MMVNGCDGEGDRCFKVIKATQVAKLLIKNWVMPFIFICDMPLPTDIDADLFSANSLPILAVSPYQSSC